jgi:SPP1 family predicted phage head-tail adaptor
MRVGDLRHLITIQQKTTASPAQDEYGVDQYTWEQFAKVYAAVEPLREYWTAKQTAAERAVRFRIHYTSGIIPRMRVSWNSRTFDIESVINLSEGNHEMHLMTSEVVDSA